MVRKDLGTRSVIRMSNSFQPPLPLLAPSMNSACAIRCGGGGDTCMGQLCVKRGQHLSLKTTHGAAVIEVASNFIATGHGMVFVCVCEAPGCVWGA